MSPLGVSDRNTITQGWVEDVRDQPRELAFGRQMPKFANTKVEVMILVDGVRLGRIDNSMKIHRVAYTQCCCICPYVVEQRDHVIA